MTWRSQPHPSRRTPRLRPALLILIALLLGHPGPAAAQTPPQSASTPLECGALGLIVTRPSVDPARLCPEYLVAELPHGDLPAIASIAYAPTCADLPSAPPWCGRLFFTRPDRGTLHWLGDFDPETSSYAIHTFAENLDTPTGLAWFDSAWFVLGDGVLYRLEDGDADGQADRQTILVDDLPAGSGHWSGSLNVGPDHRLYFTEGASCEACVESDSRRAALLSLNPDGTDLQIVASGLHAAFDFGWHPTTGDMWISESGPTLWGESRPLDELNQLTEIGQQFGWPYCFEGPDGPFQNPALQLPDPDFCADMTGPIVTFPPQSAPAGLTWYQDDAFPEMQGDLLLLTSGSWNRRLPTGYALYRVCVDVQGAPEACTTATGEALLDSQGNSSSIENLIPVDPFYRGRDLEALHITGQSFYPDHPVDVAVSPEGWIAIAVMEGAIIQVRPAPPR